MAVRELEQTARSIYTAMQGIHRTKAGDGEFSFHTLWCVYIGGADLIHSLLLQQFLFLQAVIIQTSGLSLLAARSH